MAEPRHITARQSTKREREAIYRGIGPIAARQWGRISTRQLLELGLPHHAIRRLTVRGFLIRIHPGIYAVGYRRPGIEARLQTALLLGGERAAISHQAAAFWLGLTDRAPARIDVRTPSHRRPRPGIRFHRTPDLESKVVRGFSVTLPATTLIDYAARVEGRLLRRAVANADRLGMLDKHLLGGSLRRGRPGSTALREALADHLPELASTLSELEDRFLELVLSAGLPTPEVNVTVGGMMVDCLFPEARLVVELDGHRYHADPAASERDRAREMRLRALGFRVVRYTWQQVTATPAQVLADLSRELRSRG